MVTVNRNISNRNAKRKNNKEQNIPKSYEQIQKHVIVIGMGITNGKEKEKGAEETFKAIMANCPKLVILIVTSLPD